jgi:hypothetical protein
MSAPEIIVLGPDGGVFQPTDPNEVPWTLVRVDNPDDKLEWRALLGAPAKGHFLAFHTHNDLVTWAKQVADQLPAKPKAAKRGS